MDVHIGPPLPISSLRLMSSPVRLVSGAIWHTVQHHIVSDYGMLEEFVSMVTDIVPELLSVEEKAELLRGLHAQNGFHEELGCRYDEALGNVTWQFISRLEKLLPLQTIQQVAFMLADIPSALEECLKSVSHCGELQSLLGCRKELLDRNASPLEVINETSALLLCARDDIKAEEGKAHSLHDVHAHGPQIVGQHTSSSFAKSEEMEMALENDYLCARDDIKAEEGKPHTLHDVHAYGPQIVGQYASTSFAMSEEMEMALENEPIGGTRTEEFMDVFDRDCRVLLKRLEDVPYGQRRPRRVLFQEKTARRSISSRNILSNPQASALEASVQSSMDPFSSVTYTIADDDDDGDDGDDDDADSVNSLDDPSYMAPVGSSSEELESPREGKKPSVSLKKLKYTQIQLAAANRTSKNTGLCLICNMHVQTDMKEHIKTHFPEGILTCPQCDTRFKNMQSLRLHLKRVCFDQLQLDPDKVTQGLFKCDECQRSFRYRLQLNKHKLSHHQLYCAVCRRVVRDAQTLARHKLSHASFQCTLCERNFANFKHLSSHYQNIHQLTKPYKCQHCPKVFDKFHIFIRHEWQHTGQLPFQCPHCAMKFKQDADLVIHQRVHTREKPYLCMDCGKSFACNSSRTRHRQVVHKESWKVKRFSSSLRTIDGTHQKWHQEKHQKRQSRGQCKYCGSVLHSSRLCSQMSLSGTESNLPCTSEMAAMDGAHVDSDLVHLLHDPSHIAPIGCSSKDTFVSSNSNDHSFSAPNDHQDGLVPSKEQDAPQRKHAAVNTTDSSEQGGQCFICKKHLQMDVKEHMISHFPDGVLTCPRCDTLFKNMSSLRLHFERVCVQELIETGKAKAGPSLFKCDQCVKSYRYKLALDGHKRTHNQLYCEVCRRVLRDAETLARHKVSHTPFQCTLCEENFVFFKKLLRHYENIHKLNTPYKCHHCPKVFSKLRFFIRHEWQHTGQLPFQCSQCAMKFKQDADLVVHLRVHTHEKPYLCADCGTTFSCNSNLRRHIKFRHSESREMRGFACSQCNKAFKEKSSLQKHEQRQHQNQKKARHPCMYCGKMFSQSGMVRHKLIHTGEKPLKCQIPDCDQRFRSASEVKTHVLRHHSTERPFECNTCGKGFIRACHLNEHMKIHSGGKDHVCLVCGKAFLKLYGMTRHIQLVHTPK